MKSRSENREDVDQVDARAVDLVDAWQRADAVGFGPGDVVRRRDDPAELVVLAVDGTVIPAAVKVRRPGGGPSELVPADEIDLIRRHDDPPCDLDEAIGVAARIAVGVGEVLVAASLVRLLTLEGLDRKRAAFAALASIEPDAAAREDMGRILAAAGRPWWDVRPGDLVQHATGGPIMEAVQIRRDDDPPRAVCRWIGHDADERSADLVVDHLRRVEADERPRSLRELEAFLRERPNVLVNVIGGGKVEGRPLTRFDRIAEGRIYFADGRFVPLACDLSDAAAKSETGVAIDPNGVTISKFGAKVRISYIDAPRPSGGG